MLNVNIFNIHRSVTAALASGNPEALAVVGVVFKVGCLIFFIIFYDLII